MAKLFSLSMLLCSAVIYNGVNACQGPDCVFNPQNPKHKSTVTTITAPDQSKWRTTDQLDEIDVLIFDSKSVPYSYQDINQTPLERVYVIKNDFMKICTQAKNNLYKREKVILEPLRIIRSGQGPDDPNPALYELYWRAEKRLEEYKNTLNEGNSPRHICPGFTIPKKTARCVKQWAFLQND
jgi:hypothetical protein